MIAAMSRAAMAMTVRCLGDRRREWGLAMQAEFRIAEEDGRPLLFALGCLIAAWRGLPAHEEGRLTLASYALALLLLVPMSAVLAASVLTDFPSSYIGFHGWPGVADGRALLLNEGNRAAIPSLALLIVLLAASYLRIAWLLLDRDRTRVASLARLISAVTAALLVFSGVVFADLGIALAQAAISAITLATIALLVRTSPGEPAGPEAIPE